MGVAALPRWEDFLLTDKGGAAVGEKAWQRNTLLVHAGTPQIDHIQPTALPIFPSTTYQSESAEKLDQLMAGDIPGFSYARHGNPNVQALVEAVKQLEGAETGIATASGMAAIDAALYATHVRPNDTVLISQDVYGASLNLVGSIWAEADVKLIVADLTDLARFESLLQEHKPRSVLMETLSNPLLKVLDLPRIEKLVHQAGSQLIVDNTFTTPLMMQPLELGADIVVHSATKYFAGHGDAMGGVVLASNHYHDRLVQYVKLRGAVLGVFEAWLIHRGLRTLGVRFERQCQNAAQIAQSLLDAQVFSHVFYPLLPNHPTYSTAKHLLPPTLGGGVVTLDLGGSKDTVFRFLNELKLVASATTVGDIYTLCLYPVVASHRNQTPKERDTMGITDSMVRVSVGLEDPEDVVRDIIQAAKSAQQRDDSVIMQQD